MQNSGWTSHETVVNLYLGLERIPSSKNWWEGLAPGLVGEDVVWLTFSLKRSSHFMVSTYLTYVPFLTSRISKIMPRFNARRLQCIVTPPSLIFSQSPCTLYLGKPRCLQLGWPLVSRNQEHQDSAEKPKTLPSIWPQKTILATLSQKSHLNEYHSCSSANHVFFSQGFNRLSHTRSLYSSQSIY